MAPHEANPDSITRAEAAGMITAALTAEREAHQAEMQSLAARVDAGFRAIGRALDAATAVLGEHSGYIVDLTSLALAEEVRSGRLAPFRFDPDPPSRRRSRRRRRC